jgi:formylglycine-generating enzyme required for sulfatase activity
VRSYLIHRLGPLGVDASTIAKRLGDEADVTIRRALILSLGAEQFAEETWRPGGKKQLVEQLQHIYRTDTDAGMHAAIEWLLRQWGHDKWLRQTNDEWAAGTVARGAWQAAGTGKPVPSSSALHSPPTTLYPPPSTRPSPGWYVNTQGQTMVVIPGPVEFVMGSPLTETVRGADHWQHNKRIGRSFALAAKSVTLEQYRKFEPRHGVGELERWARTPDSPVLGANWFQAAEYCNWLSEQEGLPSSEWCYVPLVDRRDLPALAGSSLGMLGGPVGALGATLGLFPGRTRAEYKGGMKLAPDHLKRAGYRLPTEAEIEYATRAGATTSRYYGETDDLLEKYAWHMQNAQDHPWPVGYKKPNDYGLFDIQGNVFTWCQEHFHAYPQTRGTEVSDDKEDRLTVTAADPRVLRGGAFNNLAVLVRSARRVDYVPTFRSLNIGIRVARTLAP